MRLLLGLFFLFFSGLVTSQDITYDYVIAGAGTAGMLLAVVLTENPNVTVAVLEAGTDGRTNPNITIPELRGEIQMTPYDWGFESTLQPGLYENRSQYVPRGKTIGGTSAMNWMIHNEDSTVQLDVWEQVLNLTGWNWETLSTAFRESETFYAPPANMSSIETYELANHGSNGPICSTLQRSVLSLIPDYLEPTLRAAGYAIPIDRNGGNVTGAGFLPLAICPQNYTRSYSGSAYTAVESRANLHLHTSCQVTGINWQSSTLNSSNVTATGLRYVNKTSGSNESISISAREVILSAGTIQSPQILELSGIGNSSILRSVGIQPVIDLPSVGTDLRDPLMMMYEPLQWNFTVNFTGGEYAQNFIDLEPAEDILEPADFEAASVWLNSTSHVPGLSDAQFEVFKYLWFNRQPLIEMAWQYSNAQTDPYTLVPLSRGTVHINSSDPLAPPEINPNYNSVKAVINGTTVDWDLWFLSKASQKYVTDLVTHAPMNNVVTRTDPPYNASFEDYQNAVYQRMGTSQHITGGCPMLPQDAGGCVDDQMLVYGTSNVRVVDGSIFPYQPSAHPMGLTYAVAVHAARILQGLQGGGGLTYTEELPASNSSANATASFPNVSPTVTYNLMGNPTPIPQTSGVSASGYGGPVATGAAAAPVRGTDIGGSSFIAAAMALLAALI